jgi:hypothetical protein
MSPCISESLPGGRLESAVYLLLSRLGVAQSNGQVHVRTIGLGVVVAE